jgi:hypothetical protein
MSAKPIYEEDAKRLLSKYLQNTDFVKCQNALVTESQQWDDVISKSEWLNTQVSMQNACCSHLFE